MSLLTRHIWITSARSPKFSRPRMNGAYGESGSRQALLSVPTRRKLVAPGSTSPSITSISVSLASGSTRTSPEPFGALPSALIVLVVGSSMTTSWRCESTHRPLASTAAEVKQAMAPAMAAPIVIRCGQVRRVGSDAVTGQFKLGRFDSVSSIRSEPIRRYTRSDRPPPVQLSPRGSTRLHGDHQVRR